MADDLQGPNDDRQWSATRVNSRHNSAVATIDHEPWWRDVVTDRARNLVSNHKSGRCTAWMPYEVSNNDGYAKLVMPPAANLLRRVIEPPAGRSAAKIRRGLSLTSERILQVPNVLDLPNVHSFSQNFHPDAGSVIACQDASYTGTVRDRFVIPPARNETAWRNLSDKTRNAIGPSRKPPQVETILDPNQFVAI